MSKRISIDVDETHDELLRDAYAEDGITKSDRVRALILLWTTDKTLKQHVADTARELAKERILGRS